MKAMTAIEISFIVIILSPPLLHHIGFGKRELGQSAIGFLISGVVAVLLWFICKNVVLTEVIYYAVSNSTNRKHKLR